MTAAHDDAFVGQVVGGRYEVVARIGRGAMGAIYEVRHTKLKRSFALKRLMPHLANDKEALERFQREADVVAGLRHPNVVEIVDWETLADGTPCIVMELLRGENLEQRLARTGKLPWPELYAVGEQVLSALAVAHKAGIVHRDLKPQNIYLARDDSGEERVKLLDFGISKVRGSGHTHVGAVMGTPAYMAPEQADSRADEIGPATDLWAMGAILYELATGEQPFTGPSASAVVYKVCYGAPEPLAQKRADGEPRFYVLVEQLLHKRAGERPADAETVRRVLRELAKAPASSRSPSVPDLTVTDVRPMPANTTTLSRTTGESVEVAVEPPRKHARARALAGIGVVAIAVGLLALRPGARTSIARPAAEPAPSVVAAQPVATAQPTSPPVTAAAPSSETKPPLDAVVARPGLDSKRRRAPKHPRIVAPAAQKPSSEPRPLDVD